jgi:hypothetical protein
LEAQLGQQQLNLAALKAQRATVKLINDVERTIEGTFDRLAKWRDRASRKSANRNRTIGYRERDRRALPATTQAPTSASTTLQPKPKREPGLSDIVRQARRISVKEAPRANVGRVSTNQGQFVRRTNTDNAHNPATRRVPEHVTSWTESKKKRNPVGTRFSSYQDLDKPNDQGLPITTLRYSESPQPRSERVSQTAKVEPGTSKIKVEPQSPRQKFPTFRKEEPTQPSNRSIGGLFGNTSSSSPFADLTNMMAGNTLKTPVEPMLRPEPTLDANQPAGGLFSNTSSVSPFATLSALSSGTNRPAASFRLHSLASGTEDRIKKAKDSLSGFLRRTTSASGGVLSTPATFDKKRKASDGESPHVQKRAKTFTGTNFSFAPAGVYDREVTELFD